MKKYLHQFHAMGSPCELVFYTDSDNTSKTVIDEIVTEVSRLEGKYSRYREDSITSEINRTSTRHTITERQINLEHDQETRNLLDYANIAWQQSDGLFDITSGIFRKVWDFKSKRLPSKTEIAEVKRHVGWQHIEWQNPKLVFTQQNMEIDFGGYVKEYAVDKVAEIYRNLNISNAYVDLGGDICVIGPQPDGSPWRVGIRNPRAPKEPIATINLQDAAIASSGDYERFMVVDGQRYCHIINPQTGKPVNYLSAVSVVADKCLIAGTASTITMLREKTGGSWLDELGLPSITINRHGDLKTNNGLNLGS